jgi:hypothetical protein
MLNKEHSLASDLCSLSIEHDSTVTNKKGVPTGDAFFVADHRNPN